MEAGFATDAVRVRSSVDADRVLVFTHREWGAFVAGVKAGEFDLPGEAPS